MGYIYLMISLSAGTAKGFFGKKISAQVNSLRDAAATNVLRMVLCCGISLLLMLTGVENSGFSVDLSGAVIGGLAGVFLSAFTITWLFSVQHGAFVLVSVAQMFGVIVTLLCSCMVLHSRPTFLQYTGIAVLIAAVLIMGSYSKKLKGNLSAKAVILIALCGLFSGLYDFTLKLFTHYSSGSKSMLNLLTYAVSAVILLGVVLLSKKSCNTPRLVLKPLLLPIILMSVFLFLNSYFKALATEHLDATQLYPIYQAGGLILSAAMSAVFFKERITLRCILGMALAFCAIVLLK